MFKSIKRIAYAPLGIMLVLLLAIMVKGCDPERHPRQPSSPANTLSKDVSLTITCPPDVQAKAAELRITAVGVDANDVEIGPQIDPLTISILNLPLSPRLMLFVPPCRYRITVSVIRSRDLIRDVSVAADVCEHPRIKLTLPTFEEFQVYENPIQIDVPEPVKAGQTLNVRCGTTQVSAPDSDRYPLSADLWEKDGQGVSGPFDASTVVAGSFPDPYPLASLEERRVFTCIIKDGRSPDQTFAKTVRRLLPAPTPTPTPTPDPCQVQNENDSGEGSLRQVLADAPTNGCTTINFASVVSTITLTSGELTALAMSVMIDGGSGVTINGNNSSRVLYVNSGANLTLQGLTITGGDAADGGGIYNNSGTVTVNSTVSNNTATNRGGGIYNYYGTIEINGAIMNNTATFGGGIFNDSGIITVNGTVRNNTTTSTSQGGGIYTWNGTVNVNGVVSTNTATYGGGIFNDGTSTTTVNGLVSANTATWGGGIKLLSGTIYVSGTVSDNTATFRGGGIDIDAGTANFGIGNLIQNNTSNGGLNTGGGIYIVLGGAITGSPRDYGIGNIPENCAGTGTGCP